MSSHSNCTAKHATPPAYIHIHIHIDIDIYIYIYIQGVSKKTRPLEINPLLLSTRFYAPGNLK